MDGVRSDGGQIFWVRAIDTNHGIALFRLGWFRYRASSPRTHAWTRPPHRQRGISALMMQTSIKSWLKKPLPEVPILLSNAVPPHTNDAVAASPYHENGGSLTSRQSQEKEKPAEQCINEAQREGPNVASWSFLKSSQPLPANIELAAVTAGTLAAFRRLNALLLPVPYPDKFYNETLNDPVAASISLVALWHDTARDGKRLGTSRVVGGIRCRLLAHPPAQAQPAHASKDTAESCESTPALYISTIGVLAPFRHLGIASALLQSVVRHAIRDYGVASITAHVWEANDEGRKWYQKMSFHEVRFEQNYYRRLKPPGAWTVERDVGVLDMLDAEQEVASAVAKS